MRREPGNERTPPALPPERRWQRRYDTPTGDPCPRHLRVDGTVEGSGDCHACGCCLLGLSLF